MFGLGWLVVWCLCVCVHFAVLKFCSSCVVYLVDCFFVLGVGFVLGGWVLEGLG